MSRKSGSRLSSFSFAFAGLKALFRTEPNARIHLGITLMVITLGIYFRITTIEWLFIILCIGIVFITELINTAIEFLCDHVTGEWHENIKRIKDLTAAAVLISAFMSLIAGLIIFIPYLAEK